MMKRIIVSLAVLAVAASAYAGPLIPLANSAAGNLSNAQGGVYVATDGTIYVAGTSRETATVNIASYWKITGGVSSAPNQLPSNTGGTKATQAYGIAVMADGTVVMNGNLAGGVADWKSGAGGVGNGAGAAGNGWDYRNVPPSGGQATLGGTQGQIRRIDGTSFYNLGKNASSADVGISYAVTASTGSAVSDTWSLVFGGATTKAGTVNGISANGIAVGEMRANFGTFSGIRRAYIHDSLGVLLLPGIAGRSDQRAQGFGISADGKTAVGLARWTDADTYEFPAYWTDPTGTGVWSSKKLGRLASYTSSSVAYAADETGRYIVGYEYPNTTVGETSCFWDTTDVDINGVPKVHLITDYLTGLGIDWAAEWKSFGRMYGVSTVDGKTVMVGTGAYWTDETKTASYTRGFVLVIPEPATLSFLALGALAMLRRRR